jgi:REP element-mobilizing transposase RayT
MDSEPKYFNPFAEVEVTANNLPHWQQPGATYFITFRLGDSISAKRLEEWHQERKAWLALNPEPWSQEVEMDYHRLFSRQIDHWLDAGQGDCHLRKEEFRKPLVDTLRHGEEDRYRLHSWVVMPNHVHVLVTLAERTTLEIEIGAWKSISARRINRLLERSGNLWQEDYFDRLVRDREHFGNCIRYIRRNPEKARLEAGACELFESDLALEFAPRE